MNRIPPTLLSGAPREAAELKRRMAMILDKPIALGTHYSADESPDGDGAKILADNIDRLPCTVKPLANQHRKESWVGTALTILLWTCIGMGALAFVIRKIQE